MVFDSRTSEPQSASSPSRKLQRFRRHQQQQEREDQGGGHSPRREETRRRRAKDGRRWEKTGGDRRRREETRRRWEKTSKRRKEMGEDGRRPGEDEQKTEGDRRRREETRRRLEKMGGDESWVRQQQNLMLASSDTNGQTSLHLLERKVPFSVSILTFVTRDSAHRALIGSAASGVLTLGADRKESGRGRMRQEV